MKLEVVIIPVSDVERAKEFYMNCYEAIIMGRTQWETRTRQV